MKKLMSAGLGLMLAVAACQTAVAAMRSPAGHWEIEMRDSRYDVAMCGADSTQLCATLVWLGNGADSAENLPYLDTLLIDHALKVREGIWRGKMSIYGQRATGTITQVNDNQFTLQGCVFLVVCKSYQMYRLQ